MKATVRIIHPMQDTAEDLDGDTLLLSSDAARIANVTPATVRYWTTTGKLRAKRTPSGVRLIRYSDLKRVIAERSASAAASKR